MIGAVIAWAMQHRLVCGALAVLAAAFGLYSWDAMPVDALPDLSENQVIVSADWPGRSPQDVEAQVTQPLSLVLHGISGVKTIRASSMFGFALLTVVFEDGVPGALARQRTSERLGSLTPKLPAGVAPALGPDATGLGWIFEYYLAVDAAQAAAGGLDLAALRALQDTFIGPQLNAVPGVAEVASIGGFVKQYQVEIDPAKMSSAGVTLDSVLVALGGENASVGGRTIEENGLEFVVRGLGALHGRRDLESVVLAARDNLSITLQEIARVEVGGAFRRGALDVGGAEAVGGIVVMHTGESAREVLRRIRAKVAQVQAGLPPGVVITPFYDRGELIDRSLATLQRTLWEEILLVVVVHVVFLRHLRSILIVTLPLPLSLLVSFAGLKLLGITANLMSLAGLAIAVGVLVDGAIVLTENALRCCAAAEQAKRRALLAEERFAVVLQAAQQVGRPIFFALAIILFSFLPVFALSGAEGKLFHPLALAKTFAVAAAMVFCVTVAPALCSALLRGPYRAEDLNPMMRILLRGYDPALRFALAHPRRVLVGAAILAAAALVLVAGLPRAWSARLTPFPRLQRLARGLGSEFMPPLNEGTLLFMPTFLPGTSFSEVQRVMAWQDRVLQDFPEVRSAVGKLGRAETATDPAPVQMIETTITLQPESRWRPGLTRQGLIREFTTALQMVPGSVPAFLQPIQGRILMLSTGLRAQLGVKLFGDRLSDLEPWALEAEKIVRSVRGAAGVAASRVQGQPTLEIEPDRAALRRYGMRVQDVLEAVEIGCGGREAGAIFEGRQRVPIQVRWQRSAREDIEGLREVLITGGGGQGAPLGQLAAIRRVTGPAELNSENGRLRVAVQAGVDEEVRDLASFVEEVKARLARELQPRLPAGVTMEYSGDYENQLHARATLRFILPAALLIIFALLHRVYGRATEAAHVLLAVPFALSGGVFFQWAAGIPFSVAVWIGYLALFGTAVQTAVVMVVYLEEAVARVRRERGAGFCLGDLRRAVGEGARLRLRPKVMTVATIVASLLPVLWSTRTGAEIVRPIAIPIIGGMLSSLVHVLIVTPAIFLWLRSRELPSFMNSAGRS